MTQIDLKDSLTLSSRRDWLKQAASLGTTALCSGQTNSFSQSAAPSEGPHRIRVGVSTYSYWHFRDVKYPIEKVIDHAARLGFDGVEILHVQMEEESSGYLNKLKRAAFVNGLDLIMLSIHQDFVSPDPLELEGDPKTLPQEHGKETLEELFITVAREPLALELG
jgi:L-ribulose-5-phosphate 3-epimerase